ncbi:oxidoreductase domain protein [Planctopirus limnophila DSM 3776]|uniref:Oxidoreductase domain protein n=1 Tax=Planctopirus limnophila (strain ATCC 43296 / DSM 3776 / IFAM 1008 / Mu 290) TaxID=521674 RepID=D5SW80_PLAL2|nr:Gfo/Idh/MocA family oxidoreductase [Planctopirus limnophila]ADG67365.1 oxidoreductase domain protein [Planctopirus limnophila DSM 3776]
MPQNRREFLENSLSVGAALACAGGLNAVQAQETAPKKTGDKINVCVVGVNGRGGEHIRGFSNNPDSIVYAIVDVDQRVGESKAALIEKEYKHRPKVYTDLREAYADKNVDVVSVATPNHWHALAAIWAIQAGKDVYVEKPVSHNVVEGRRLVEAARKYNKIVQCGTQSRSNPGLKEAIKYIHDGQLGEVKLARGLCYKPRNSIGPRSNYEPPSTVNLDLWTGPAPLAPLTRKNFHYDWHWQWPYGNGDLGNQGIHQMDIARWALNENSIGDSVMSYGGRYGYEDAGDTANTQVCFHSFGDKRLIFEVRGLKTDAYMGAKVGVIVYGSEGYMVIPSYSSATVFSKDGKEIKQFKGGSDQNHYNNFIEAFKARDMSKLNAEILEGHLSSALCHVGNISYRLGSLESLSALENQLAKDPEGLETTQRFAEHLKANGVDLTGNKIQVGPLLKILPNETFTGPRSEEANAMLSREYRAPYLLPTTEQL